MDKEFGHKLIGRLYESGNLSLKECGNKRGELNKLEENQIEKFLKSLPNGERFLLELIEKELLWENALKKELFWENALKKDNPSLPMTFFENVVISVFAPVTLFIIFFYIASIASENFSDYYNQGQPFDFQVTWWVWVIYIFFLVPFGLQLHKAMRFKTTLQKISLYPSIILTVVSTILFILSLLVQYGDGEASRIGKSTRDGFMFYVFWTTYLAPSISWLIYYLVIKKGDALNKVIKGSRKIKDEKKQVVKRSEAVKQIKEAKELLDLGVLSQAEYDELTKKLKPIILNN